jgi:dTDP-4-dehydrorhamnose reductase
VTLLVTGATGYLGRELLRQGDAAGPRFDIRDEAVVREALESLRPTAVINTAYRVGERAATYAGAVNVARAAAAIGARLVQISTDVVFDGEKGSPYVEADEPTPITDYGRDKADAERGVMAEHPEALVVRTSLIYGGPEPGPQERMAADPDARFFTDEFRCPIQVCDLASALLELVRCDRSGILHVAGAERVSRAEFAARLTGAPVRTATIVESGLRRPRDCALATGRARGLLRTRLRGVREVLAGP